MTRNLLKASQGTRGGWGCGGEHLQAAAAMAHSPRGGRGRDGPVRLSGEATRTLSNPPAVSPRGTGRRDAHVTLVMVAAHDGLLPCRGVARRLLLPLLHPPHPFGTPTEPRLSSVPRALDETGVFNSWACTRYPEKCCLTQRDKTPPDNTLGGRRAAPLTES